MSKQALIPILLFGLAMLAQSSLADTVTLKSGERIEGVITGETATELELEIKESAGILDHRTIKKTEVAKVDRLAPDEAAYRAIMHLQPAASTLLPAQYEPIITALRAFATQHPDSSHKGSVQATLNAFETEKKRVDAGEVKFEGLWRSRDEAQKLRVQIGGAQAFNAMKVANASGDAIGALNAFVVLEKNFPGSKVMPDAVDLARQILVGLKPVAQQAIATSKVIIAERQKGLVDAGPRERPEMVAAYQREQARADAALAAATAAGQWPPFINISEKCLTAILGRIPSEILRLEKIPVAPMRESVKLAEKGQAEFAAKDYAAASETLKGATRLWAANEMATRLQVEITAAKIPPKPELVASSTPATPPKSVAVQTPPRAITPAPASSTAQADNAHTPATGEAESAEEPPKPFFMTLGGAITIVLVLAVILGGLNVFNKLRSRANETLE